MKIQQLFIYLISLTFSGISFAQDVGEICPKHRKYCKTTDYIYNRTFRKR